MASLVGLMDAATDAEIQSDVPPVDMQPRTSQQLWLLAGLVTSGLVVTAAFATTSTSAQWENSAGAVSDENPALNDFFPSTGCADWENSTIGKPLNFGSRAECEHECAKTEGCKYSNYQPSHCHPDHGGAPGSCHLFRSCEKELNTCWDLTQMEENMTTADDAEITITNLTEPVAAGATSITVASEAGFTAGSTITFSGGGNTETRTIVGFASILLDSPLQHSYPAGSTISQMPTTTTTAAENTTSGTETTTDDAANTTSKAANATDDAGNTTDGSTSSSPTTTSIDGTTNTTGDAASTTAGNTTDDAGNATMTLQI